MQCRGHSEIPVVYNDHWRASSADSVIFCPTLRILQTTRSIVFMYSVSLLGNSSLAPVYSVPSTGTGAAKGQFVAGSGEAQALPPLVLEEVGLLDFSESEISA